MAAVLAALEELPRQNATRVKNQWGDVVRLVQQQGSVAVTNHAKVEMVLVNAKTYEQLVKDSELARSREHQLLDELAQRFDDRLAVLQAADADARVQGLLAARGALRARPKAGATY